MPLIAMFLQRLDSRHKMVFVDNPNNPTGQVIPLAEIRRIASAAARLGIGVVVDEAYGDYMAKENSAINLLDDFDNVVVLRTFSKRLRSCGHADWLLPSKRRRSWPGRCQGDWRLTAYAFFPV